MKSTTTTLDNGTRRGTHSRPPCQSQSANRFGTSLQNKLWIRGISRMLRILLSPRAEHVPETWKTTTSFSHSTHKLLRRLIDNGLLLLPGSSPYWPPSPGLSNRESHIVIKRGTSVV